MFHKPQKKNITLAIIKSVAKRKLNNSLCFQSKYFVQILQDFLALDDYSYCAYFDNPCAHHSWVKSNKQIANLHWTYQPRLKPNQYFIHYYETALKLAAKVVAPQHYRKSPKTLKAKAKY